MTTSTSTDGSKTAERSEPAATPTTAPSAELLEFLGEFADGDGGWIDPLELEEDAVAEEDEEETDLD